MIGILVASLLSGCSTLRQAKLLEPTWFGMERIGPRVFAAKEVPQSKRLELLDAYRMAGERVRAVYGSIHTDPAVYGCAEPECIRAFGGYGDGYAAGKVTPGILLWTKVFGPGEVAHEWSHLELHARIGGPGMGTIPMWFHEGLATVVGGIPRHSEAVYRQAVLAGLPIPALVELRTETQWGEAVERYRNAENLNVVYATAGHLVSAWLRRVGDRGLPMLIDAMSAGEDFETAFRRVERQSATSD